ncbi:MAG: glycosyltransferase family 4 protein [Actinobacteria bacterium]|nr:glycosyltransferase family 4 protein [Actinomycetota bacterium]
MAGDSLSFCMVTTFYPPYHFGGEAMYIYRLSNELAKLGHRVTVVHCIDSFRTLTKAAPRGSFPQHEKVVVHRLKSRLGTVSPLVTYLSGRPGLKTPELRRIFDAESFDVVHFHLVTLFGPGVLSFGGDAVKLYTTHDHWLVCPMYDLWKQNRELCEQPECLRCTLSFRRPPQLWRYTDLLERELPRVDLFLSPSESTIREHRRRGFDYPMRHLPYFLPLAEATAPPPAGPVAGPAQGRPYFLFVGRLVKLKGAQTLIEAFRRYNAADLLIAGDGIYAEELRRQAEGLGHVRFLGRVHPDVLRGLYAGATAVLVPSLVYETFGFITLEALAQRTPVIATELGAVGELARESGGGLTYRDEKELIAAMERLRTNPGLRDELGERGYAAFVERWSEEPHLRAYFDFIEEASARRGHAGRLALALSET